MSETKDIREYRVIYNPDNSYANVRVYGGYSDAKIVSAFPSKKELEALFSASGFDIGVASCFVNSPNIIGSPRLPEEIYQSSTYYYGLYSVFQGCTSIKVPPKLPPAVYAYYTFDGCTALEQAPVLQSGLKYANYMFRNCSALLAPPSIPKTTTRITGMFEGCTVMAGEMIIRPSSLTVTDALKNTTGTIKLYGNQALCESIAATANNGNATWSAWYAPVPAVKNRGPGSYTTAADMTRMVRNGALAVDTYAPARMMYQQGDIVREDEWIALVEAAKTIDPTVTLSSNYVNLNKIEAAFESAL